MNGQGSMFDIGDPAGDELVRVTDDGANVREPSLWQQDSAPTSAETAAEIVAAEQVAAHRATQAEHPDPEQVREMFKGLGWSVTE